MNTYNPHQQQQYMKEQQEKAMQDDRYRNQPSAMPPTPTSPIRTALELMDIRISNLQNTTGLLLEKLKPVTSNTDDNHPGEPAVAREGNSSINIDINAMADRVGAIEAGLRLQIDRLEV